MLFGSLARGDFRPTSDVDVLAVLKDLIPVLVACALDFDLRNSLNMGIMFLGKRASASQIGMNKGRNRELTGDFQMETAARTFDLISLLLFDEREWLHGDEPIRRVILKEGIAI